MSNETSYSRPKLLGEARVAAEHALVRAVLNLATAEQCSVDTAPIQRAVRTWAAAVTAIYEMLD